MSRELKKRWIEWFKKSPLVRTEVPAFDKRIASQLFYGKKGRCFLVGLILVGTDCLPSTLAKITCK